MLRNDAKSTPFRRIEFPRSTLVGSPDVVLAGIVREPRYSWSIRCSIRLMRPRANLAKPSAIAPINATPMSNRQILRVVAPACKRPLELEIDEGIRLVCSKRDNSQDAGQGNSDTLKMRATLK